MVGGYFGDYATFIKAGLRCCSPKRRQENWVGNMDGFPTGCFWFASQLQCTSSSYVLQQMRASVLNGLKTGASRRAKPAYSSCCGSVRRQSDKMGSLESGCGELKSHIMVVGWLPGAGSQDEMKGRSIPPPPIPAPGKL
jgi:hypothetical protein